MSPWIATLERLFGGINFIDGPSFLRAAVGAAVILFLLHILFRWPDFKRVRWRFAYAIYGLFLLSLLFFPMPVSRASIAILQLMPRSAEWTPLVGLFQSPGAVLWAWVRENSPWLLLFIPLGALSVFCHPRRHRLRLFRGPALSIVLLLTMLLLNRVMGASYLPIRADRAIAWAMGFFLGQALVLLVQRIRVLRAAKRVPVPPARANPIPLDSQK